MAFYNRPFSRFVGGAEVTTEITHAQREEASDPAVPLDLTGYDVSAEVWWEGCRRFSPEVVIGDLAAGNPHYTVTLNEQQTACVPLGRIGFVKLIRVKDGVTTAMAPLWLERTA